jgi:hypothetical protein
MSRRALASEALQRILSSMITKGYAGLLLAALVLLGGGSPRCRAEEASSGNEVQVEMQNVMYHFTDSVSVHIVQLQGRMIPAKPAPMVVFDDKSSFTLAITSAQISISVDALARVLNEYVFNESDSPVKNVSISAMGNTLLIKGKLHQKGNVPFEATASLTASAGQIRVHTEKLRAAHLPMKGLLDLLGLKLSNLIDMKKVLGVTTDGNDLILDPRLVLPPPHISGIVTAVSIEGNDIIQTFGKSDRKHKFQPGNYMAYKGNQLRFGKLIMNETDLTLLDMDPRNPFDFCLDHYRDQLVAGYTKTTKDFGLRVFMRDYDQLPGTRAQGTAAPRTLATRSGPVH